MSIFDFIIPTDVVAVRNSMDRGDTWKPMISRDAGDVIYLTHVRTGLNIWTRNRPYGLEIYNRLGASLWGGVTFLSSFRLSPGHWSLYFAIIRWECRNGFSPRVRQVNLSAAEILSVASVDGRRMAETENTGSVRSTTSAVPKADAQ